jgi:hypothetical protein
MRLVVFEQSLISKTRKKGEMMMMMMMMMKEKTTLRRITVSSSCLCTNRDSVVGIATSCGLDD